MDPSLLEPDEFKIECELRNIRGLLSVQLSMLQFTLAEEASDKQQFPDIAHEKARKQPKREISACAKSIVDIQESLVMALKSKSEHKALIFNTMKSRALHYRFRLNRIAKSEAVALEYPSASQLCDKLLDALQQVDIEDSNLDKSIQQLEDLDMSRMKDIVDKNVDTENLQEAGTDCREIPISNISTINQILPGVSTASGSVVKQMHPYLPEQFSVTSITCQNQIQFNRPYYQFSNLPNTTLVSQAIPFPVVSMTHHVHNQNFGFQSQPGARLTTSHITDVLKDPVAAQKLNSIFSQQSAPAPIVAPPVVNANMNIPVTGLIASSPHHQQSPYVHDFGFQPQAYTLERSSPIYKWNISFDGSKSGLNVERFLYRVETNASSYNVPQHKLLTDIQYLLKGKALNWFWAYKEANHPHSWFELRNALQKQFQDVRNDFDIRQSIGERKQKPNESFQDFFTAISELTLALSEPLRDFELMLILHGNMRPGLKEKLAGKRFNSASSLFDECVYIENDWRQINYIPERHMIISSSRPISSDPNVYSRSGYNPNTRQVHEIENEYSGENDLPLPECNDLLPNNVSAFTSQNYQSTRGKFTQTPFPKHLLDKIQCWNCLQLGHFAFNCSLPDQHIYCRGCGQDGVIHEYCVKCQGNVKREVRSGMLPSQSGRQNPTQKPETMEAAANTDPEFYRMLRRGNQQ